MNQGKNRIKMVKQLCDSDGNKIDGIPYLNDLEMCQTGSFTIKILTKQKWLLTM